jgi:hypothetical protein
MAQPNATTEQLHPRKRTRVLLAAAAVAPVGLGLVVDKWVWPAVMSWLQTPGLALVEREARVGIIVAALLGALVLPCIAVTLWFWLIALRIHREGVFPPRGYPIIALTPVVRGSAAKRPLLWHLLLGALSASLGIYVLWAVFTIFPVARALRAIGG